MVRMNGSFDWVDAISEYSALELPTLDDRLIFPKRTTTMRLKDNRCDMVEEFSDFQVSYRSRDFSPPLASRGSPSNM